MNGCKLQLIKAHVFFHYVPLCKNTEEKKSLPQNRSEMAPFLVGFLLGLETTHTVESHVSWKIKKCNNHDTSQLLSLEEMWRTPQQCSSSHLTFFFCLETCQTLLQKQGLLWQTSCMLLYIFWEISLSRLVYVHFWIFKAYSGVEKVLFQCLCMKWNYLLARGSVRGTCKMGTRIFLSPCHELCQLATIFIKWSFERKSLLHPKFGSFSWISLKM